MRLWKIMSMNLMLIAAASGMALAQQSDADKPDEEQLTAEQKMEKVVTLARKVEQHLVRVEIYFQYDRGDEPVSQLPRVREEGLMRQERPVELTGVMLDARRVALIDPQIHPRFVKQIKVVADDQTYNATMEQVTINHAIAILRTEQPINEREPITFAPQTQEDMYVLNHFPGEGTWRTSLEPLALKIQVNDRGKVVFAPNTFGMVVNEEAQAVGFIIEDQIPVERGWRGSPMDWPRMSVEQLEEKLNALEQGPAQALVRVLLNFRSPKLTAQDRFEQSQGLNRNNPQTEMHVPGIMLTPNRVLVLAKLDPRTTARLRKITVYPVEGDGIEAEFVGSLKDYGALLADTTQPLEHHVEPASLDTILDHRDQLSLAVRMRLYNEQRVTHFQHHRIGGFNTGWKNTLHPSGINDDAALYLFDRDMQLLAFPMERRPVFDPSIAPWQQRQDESQLWPGHLIGQWTGDVSDDIDLANVPLDEDNENRLIWLGLMMQPMTEDMARTNRMADLTNNGSVGGMVTYVYPDSPADEAGVETGWFLLRLYVEDYDVPLNLSRDLVRSFNPFTYQPFPWDRLDQAPAEAFENLPTPWPGIENNFTRVLTRIGKDSKIIAEFYHDGQIVKKQFDLEAAPTHYITAERFKADTAGLTVRNVTFEVRRYLQMDADDPGVVISKIESGEEADSKGLKPYEIITHVEDQPVHNIEQFEQMIADGGEIKLTVKRQYSSRIVTLDLSAADGTAEDGNESAADQPMIFLPDAPEVDAEVSEDPEMME